MIAGLILAAGAGTRFVAGVGTPSAAGVGTRSVAGAAGGGTRSWDGSKLLAELGGRPLVEYAIAAQCAVPEISRVVVVLGADADEIRQRVSFGRAEVVVCHEWSRGQAASLRCGLSVLPDADRVIITLGDEPLITPEVIGRFVHAPLGSRAVYDGHPGHPVVLGPDQVSALAALMGDRGARDVLRGGPTIECGELCSGRDVDTVADLQAIRDQCGQ